MFKTWQHALLCGLSYHLSSFSFHKSTWMHTFVRTNTFQDNRHLQSNLELSFESLQKCKSLSHTSRKTDLVALQNNFCRFDMWIHLEDIDNHCFERLKSLFVQTACTQIHCYRTVHFPNKFNNTIVISTIRDECATHRKASQYFHTCLRRKIGSYSGGEFSHG